MNGEQKGMSLATKILGYRDDPRRNKSHLRAHRATREQLAALTAYGVEITPFLEHSWREAQTEIHLQNAQALRAQKELRVPVLVPASQPVKPRPDYYEYIRSEEWKARRDAAVRRAGHRCQLCNTKGILNVHHRTYQNLGNEHEMDLTVLCQTCHQKFHDVLPDPQAG